ncbi:hypothetical protein DUNSADRAFT_14558 [Dunaliella salina]|uniref:Encoded protein n=1 Tax=Dunaliella salina TaxID=3046 RepID=A0ABQ7G766_DUNSA|nr:hypothetical protein DUNSADRAFT_14558 [Dunaliella salina]|eukprot:KAF5830440.1 hypothetical protein DUNSADRAFT_14558 [Dunaliella salina]
MHSPDDLHTRLCKIDQLQNELPHISKWWKARMGEHRAWLLCPWVICLHLGSRQCNQAQMEPARSSTNCRVCDAFYHMYHSWTWSSLHKFSFPTCMA